MENRLKLRRKNLVAFDYRGGKNATVNKILPYIPEHDRYIEPFCGSMAVLLNKKPCKMEIANDAEKRIMIFFEVLRDKPEDLIRKIRLTPYSRNDFLHARDVLYSGEWDTFDLVEQARLVYVFLWMNVSKSFIDRYTANNFKLMIKDLPMITRYRRQIERLSMIVDRLSNVVFENRCGIDLIKRAKGLSHRTVIYCDPPYVVSTLRDTEQVYSSAKRKEETDIAWQERFLDAVNNHDAKILISGYNNSLYMDRLNEWHKVSWKSDNLMSRTANRSTDYEYKDREECLWMNFETSDPFGLST